MTGLKMHASDDPFQYLCIMTVFFSYLSLFPDPPSRSDILLGSIDLLLLSILKSSAVRSKITTRAAYDLGLGGL